MTSNPPREVQDESRECRSGRHKGYCWRRMYFGGLALVCTCTCHEPRTPGEDES